MNAKRVSVIFVLLALASWMRVAQATDRVVPDPYPYIDQAIGVATAGQDRVVITSSGAYDPFTLNKAVPVVNESGGEVIIDGSSTTWAAQITDAGGSITGLTLRSGSVGAVAVGGGTIEDCTIEDDGDTFSTAAATVSNGGLIQGCNFTLTSGQGRAVAVLGNPQGSRAEIIGCAMNVDLESGGSYVEGIISDAGASVWVEENTIAFDGGSASDGMGIVIFDADLSLVVENTITGGGDTGIQAGCSSLYVGENLIEGFETGIDLWYGADELLEGNTLVRDACSAGSYGIRTRTLFGTAYSYFANNLIVNTAMGMQFDGGVSQDWAIGCNAFWSDDMPSCGTGSNAQLTSEQLITDLRPIFCDNREEPVAKYSHRIDSPVARGNNPCGFQIGRWGVECAFDTLAYDATLMGGETALVLEDVVVPSGLTLTLEGGAHLLFDDDDDSASGSNQYRNELIVSGRLEVSGTSGSAVVFDSDASSPAENDWYGIRVLSGAKGFLTGATIQHGYIGLSFTAVDSGLAKQCTFSANQAQDLTVGVYSGDYVTVDSCTVTIGAGTGIQLTNDGTGARITNNVLTGSSSSTYGIYTLLDSGSPTLSGNTVDGLTNGDAIRITGGTPVVTKNALTDCKYGIYTSVGSYTIGDAADTTKHNTITGHTTGILADGSSASPAILTNNISSNTYGVTAKSSANPNLGNANQDGNNKFISNATYCIWNRNTSGTISARGNYFGECEGGSPPWCSYGSVDVTDGLCTSPFSLANVGHTGMGLIPPARALALRAAPNPTGGQTTLHFEIDGSAEVEVQVFDVTGRLVRRFGRAEYGPGEHTVFWDGSMTTGQSAPAGIYFFRAIANDHLTRTARVLVVR